MPNATLLLADVFESFHNKYIEIFAINPIYFLSVPGSAWNTCLSKNDVKLELMTDLDMLLKIEKNIHFPAFIERE